MVAIINQPELIDELYKTRHALSQALTGLTTAVELLGYYDTELDGAPSLLWRSYQRLMLILRNLDEEIVIRRQAYYKLVGPMRPD